MSPQCSVIGAGETRTDGGCGWMGATVRGGRRAPTELALRTWPSSWSIRPSGAEDSWRGCSPRRVLPSPPLPTRPPPARPWARSHSRMRWWSCGLVRTAASGWSRSCGCAARACGSWPSPGSTASPPRRQPCGPELTTISPSRWTKSRLIDVLLGRELPDPPVPETPLALRRVVWEHVQRAFEQCGRNVTWTAAHLGMHRRTLQRVLGKRAPLPRGGPPARGEIPKGSATG